MFCKYCGKELPDNAVFCSHCGKQIRIKKIDDSILQTEINNCSEVKTSKFCKFCGAKIAVLAKFCPKCGKNLSQIQELKQKIEKTKTVGITTEKVHENITSQISEQIINPEPIVQKSPLIQSEQTVTEQNNQSNNSTLNYLGKFGVGNLFVQVFKKHSAKERNEILNAGLSEQDLNNIKITPEQLQPWLYSRVFLILLSVFLIFEISLLGFYNTNVMPGLMLIGSVMIPFSLLTMYFELNVYKDISFYKTIGIFLLGGAVSLLFTLFLYAIIPMTDEFNFLGASLISIIEELGKVVIVIILLKYTKNVTVLQGLLIGGAIGCGFAVFESAGYAFNAYLAAHDYNTRVNIVNDYLPWYYQYGYANSWNEMNFNIILRSVLSFGGHTAWAAIEGAAYAKENKIGSGFIKAFTICFVLHALWDMNTPATYFKLTILCFVAWCVIIQQITNFVEENKLTIKK